MSAPAKKITAVLGFMAVLVFSVFAAGGSESAAGAVEYPKKPIQVVASFGAGGANDVLARIAAKTAEKYLGQPIVVQNYAGGGQVTGQMEAWNAPADGYTLLTINPGIIQNPIMKKNLPFTYKDWEIITLYNLEPEVFVVRADSPYKTYADVIEASKKGTFLIATPGALTNPHICGMYMEKQTGAKFQYVHGGSGSEEILQLLGGHVDGVINTIGAVYSAVEEGKARVLGVMGEEVPGVVSKIAPYAATFYSQNYDVGYWAWRGLAVKKGTPAEVVKILSDAFSKAARDPEMISAIESAGFEVVIKEGKELNEFIEYQQEYMSALLSSM